MRVLVTGGSGFLGRAVVPELTRRGHDVVAMVRSNVAASVVTSLGAQALYGDLDHPRSVDAAFGEAKADALANLASLGFGHAPTVVASSEEAGIARAVFVSTTAIFTSLPAESRAVRIAAEETIGLSALEWTIIRPTMIYGAPGDRNMERVLAFLRRSPVVLLPGGGDRLLQPVHVGDLARFLMTALEGDTTGLCYNVAGPVALSLRRVVQEAAAAVRRQPLVMSVPLRPVIDAIRVYERISARPRLKVEQVLRLNEDKVFDISGAQALGYDPRSFAEGVTSEAKLLL